MSILVVEIGFKSPLGTAWESKYPTWSFNNYLRQGKKKLQQDVSATDLLAQIEAFLTADLFILLRKLVQRKSGHVQGSWTVVFGDINGNASSRDGNDD